MVSHAQQHGKTLHFHCRNAWRFHSGHHLGGVSTDWILIQITIQEDSIFHACDEAIAAIAHKVLLRTLINYDYL